MTFKSHVAPEQLALINLRKERAEIKARVERLETFITKQLHSVEPVYKSFLEAQRDSMKAYIVAVEARLDYHEGKLNE